MQVPLSDIADRFSILRLKSERGCEHSPDELEAYRVEARAVPAHFIHALYEVNGQIWDLESEIRRGVKLPNEEVGIRALAIRDYNAIRVEIKNTIARECGGWKETHHYHDPKWRPDLCDGKIFGIGLSRTGTTSLNEALRILGYTSVHLPVTLRQIMTHDAATDTSIAMGYAFLDLMFPGSKFICTLRNPISWAGSMKRFFSRIGKPTDEAAKIRNALYGPEGFHENMDLLEDLMVFHQNSVSSYFGDRPILWIDLCLECPDVEKWERLCEFLGKPIPDVPFPHLNRGDKNGHG